MSAFYVFKIIVSYHDPQRMIQMNRYTHIVSVLFIVFLYSLTAPAQSWDSVSVILKRIVPPNFPDKNFSIISFGAVSNGTTDCTVSIIKAIDSCNKAGGGKVVVPAGTFLTGAIYLKSNVNLYISPGATLLFSTDKTKYLPVVYSRFEGIECMNYSAFIYAYGETNIAITGAGKLDGQASSTVWWDWKNKYSADTALLSGYAAQNLPVAQRVFGNGHYLRPNFVQLYKCKNILIDSITINRSPMWELHPVLSQNITISNVIIDTHGVNNDGCDPESCSDVLISKCSFNTGDDCIAVKSGKNDDGRRVNVPSENIVIKNCKMQDGHGGVTLGSEMSGSIRNIYADSCSMNSSNFYSMLRLKTNSVRGGTMENIFIRNITETEDTKGCINIDMTYGEGDAGSYTPTIRNIYVENINSSKSPYAIYIVDYARSPVTNVQLKNCIFTNVGTKYVLGNAKNVIFNNVKINGTTYVTGLMEVKKSERKFRLIGNFPNPFNPSTVIRFQVGTAAFVTLAVYDMLGNLVQTLVNGEKAAGNYEVTFETSRMASGTYFCCLEAGNFKETRKMLLLK